MSSMRPGDTLSCYEFSHAGKSMANLTLTAWPQPVTDAKMMVEVAALEGKLNAPPIQAGMGAWVSLRLWNVSVAKTKKKAGMGVGVHDDQLPLGIMCDLDRFSNRGFTVRQFSTSLWRLLTNP